MTPIRTTTPASARPRVKEILSLLARAYPEPRTALRFSNPLELLVATVLSAQCTDARVNAVTAELFRKYRTAHDYAAARREDLEKDIHSTGFFRSKAKAIQGFCAVIEKEHAGQVPRSMEDLVKLPGVGRKTANLVLAEAFGIPGMVVDTHVGRVSQRLGLTARRDAEKIEQDLVQLVPGERWNHFSLQLIEHGRKVCKARNPRCTDCFLLRLCPTGLSRV
ncbi:MAG TPA: endonuclease III [Candidatus Polarisedimenticolia bacterium]|nr:endonuclease III [Candidatus Polarisedimenticolia bacterium]